MSTPSSYPSTAFPSFHLHPYPHSSLPSRLDDLTTEEIALSWLLLDGLDTTQWRKSLRIWRARRDKKRTSIDESETPVFELMDLGWEVSEDGLDQLDSAQLAALPLHPNYKVSMAERAREIFRRRRNEPAASPVGGEQVEVEKDFVLPPETPTACLEPESSTTIPCSEIASIARDETRREEASTSSIASATESPLLSTVPSSPAPQTPAEASPSPESSEANLSINKWSTITKTSEKATRTLAVDSFDWDPEPVRPVLLQGNHTLERRSISPFDESPSPPPSEEQRAQDERLTQLQTDSFFDQLRFDKMEVEEEPASSLAGSPEGDVKAVLKLEDRLAAPPLPVQPKEEPPRDKNDLLKRISEPQAATPAPSSSTSASASFPASTSASSSASTSKSTTKPPVRASLVPIPPGFVPSKITLTWHTFLVHSIVTKLPTAEIQELIHQPGLPEPVAIQIKRNGPTKRFCLVWVAFESPEARDLCAKGLDGLSYGFQNLRLIIKSADKPASDYAWDWSSTSESFRRDYFERGGRARQGSSSSSRNWSRERSPKRPRLPGNRSLSPPRRSRSRNSSFSVAPSSHRGRSPSPRRPLSPPPRGPATLRRSLSPNPSARGRSKSPICDRQPSSNPSSSLNEHVPLPLIDRLSSMVLLNLPSKVTRSDILDFFRSNLIVGVAINRTYDRRYPEPGGRHANNNGSAFLLFETKEDRDMFARRECTGRLFRGSTAHMKIEWRSKRFDPWVWEEMTESWREKNRGSSSSASSSSARLREDRSAIRPPIDSANVSSSSAADRQPRRRREWSPDEQPSSVGRAPLPPGRPSWSESPSPRSRGRDLPPIETRAAPQYPLPSASTSYPTLPAAPQAGRLQPAPARSPEVEFPTRRKRATWSEEPDEPIAAPPPSGPSQHQSQYTSYYPPVTNGVQPPPTAPLHDSFYASSSALPGTSMALDPYHLNTQALQSSAARYGYSGGTEIKRG
ncbi:uncharacterized protein JCM6883_005430 [Sporobolomyces salmoneus]|uniref:uncharacterized protein n=1 Tax=Sporobolomyces salmoneus TaxID=183962 RepID=UPI00316D2651